MGRLTTHVLDTSVGRPAAGVRVVLRRDGDVLAERANQRRRPHRQAAARRRRIRSRARYELTFHVGDYFRAHGVALADPPFLDVIPLRFAIADDAHYHVPLLVSPYGYSTYRGS